MHLLHLLALDRVQHHRPGPQGRAQLLPAAGKDLCLQVPLGRVPLHPLVLQHNPTPVLLLAREKVPRPDLVHHHLDPQLALHLEKSLAPDHVEVLPLQPGLMHPGHVAARGDLAVAPEKDPDLEVARERRLRLLALGKVPLPTGRDRGHHLGQDQGPDQQVGPDEAPGLDQDLEKARDQDLDLGMLQGRLRVQGEVQGQDLVLGKGHAHPLVLEGDLGLDLDQGRARGPGK
jgi:hypothetical protein